MNLKTNIANRSNYGGTRSTDNIKYIVVHYTGNDGDSDESNGNYFKNHIVEASAHYFVDDDSVTQSVPDNYIAYSVGGSKYPSCKASGGGKFYGLCTNKNSISVELCDTVRNGVSDFTERTLENAAELVRLLMREYVVSADRVIRHFDVVGKECPKPFVNNEKWMKFKERLADNDMTAQEKHEFDNLREQVNSLKEQLAQLRQGEEVYNWTLSCPEWSRPYVQKALDLGIIKGDENGQLGLTDTKIWCLVVALRAARGYGVKKYKKGSVQMNILHATFCLSLYQTTCL